LLPSRQEWDARNRFLADALASLVNQHAPDATGRALDVGCQWGMLLEAMAGLGEKRWWGVDPVVDRHLSRSGFELAPGAADDIPYPDGVFDCAILANVYEHIPPGRRSASLAEIRRVLAPDGVLIGQLPNPYFPIESHSKLPFMGWLPAALQHKYWSLSPSRRGAGFYTVTVRDLQRSADAIGFSLVSITKFNYPVAAAPESVRWLVRALQVPMRVVPWSWQFVFRRRG
jgi:SAM-dependent methyltransferase